MKQFEIPLAYRSPLIAQIKQQRRKEDKLKKDFSPTRLRSESLEIWLARHFGFCYGVENAIEIAFRTISENPDKNIFLLSEMIHNPKVNNDLMEMGVRFLQDTYGRQLIPYESIGREDIVIVPAFGTTLETEKLLREKGIAIEKYNTTCPFVEKVWNRGAQLAEKGYTIVIHGKPKHEETRATFSHTADKCPAIVVNDILEAQTLADFILGTRDAAAFHEVFKGRCSEGFDPEKDLKRIGVINQTTQLASETQAISHFLKETIQKKFGSEGSDSGEHFADTRDTLCYATNDNQTAVEALLETDADFALVIGGYNSSNTSHLVELCEKKLTTYFIDGPHRILDANSISHCNWATKEETISSGFLPANRPLRVLMTSGASCPDAVVEAVINRLASLTGMDATTLAH